MSACFNLSSGHISKVLAKASAPPAPPLPPHSGFPDWVYTYGPSGGYQPVVDADFHLTDSYTVTPLYGQRAGDDITPSRFGYTNFSHSMGGTTPGVVKGNTYTYFLAGDFQQVSLVDGSVNWAVRGIVGTDVLFFDECAVVLHITGSGSSSELSVVSYSLETGAEVSRFTRAGPENGSSNTESMQGFRKLTSSRFLVTYMAPYGSSSTSQTLVFEVNGAAVNSTPVSVQPYAIHPWTWNPHYAIKQGNGTIFAAIQNPANTDIVNLCRVDEDFNILWTYPHDTRFGREDWLVHPETGNIISHIYWRDVNGNSTDNARSRNSALTVLEVDGETGEYLRHHTYSDNGKGKGTGNIGGWFGTYDWVVHGNTLITMSDKEGLVAFDLESFQPAGFLPLEAYYYEWSGLPMTVFNNGVLTWRIYLDYDWECLLGWIPPGGLEVQPVCNLSSGGYSFTRRYAPIPLSENSMLAWMDNSDEDKYVLCRIDFN